MDHLEEKRAEKQKGPEKPSQQVPEEGQPQAEQDPPQQGPGIAPHQYSSVAEVPVATHYFDCGVEATECRSEVSVLGAVRKAQLIFPFHNLRTCKNIV